MTTGDKGPTASLSQLAERVEELNAALHLCDPNLLCARTGASYESGEDDTGSFYLNYWGREVGLSYPDFFSFDKESGKELGIMDRAMLAYYFTTSDGMPLSGRWIAFSELPSGTFYTQAFQGYTGGEMAKAFGNDAVGFTTAAEGVGGYIHEHGQTVGDLSFAYQVLPHVRLLASCWLGDEDFPPSYRILFDAAASHHLSTDSYAILGSMLTRRLISRLGRRR